MRSLTLSSNDLGLSYESDKVAMSFIQLNRYFILIGLFMQRLNELLRKLVVGGWSLLSFLFGILGGVLLHLLLLSPYKQTDWSESAKVDKTKQIIRTDLFAERWIAATFIVKISSVCDESANNCEPSNRQDRRC